MESKENLLDNCTGAKLVALTASIAALLAEQLSLDDQNVIGNVFCGLGQNLLVIAAQNSKYQSCVQACNDKNESKS